MITRSSSQKKQKKNIILAYQSSTRSLHFSLSFSFCLTSNTQRLFSLFSYIYSSHSTHTLAYIYVYIYVCVKKNLLFVSTCIPINILIFICSVCCLVHICAGFHICSSSSFSSSIPFLFLFFFLAMIVFVVKHHLFFFVASSLCSFSFLFFSSNKN